MSVVAALNADADRLDALLERQNYRLAFWRTAGHELGYRRFFDINTLVGLARRGRARLRRHPRADSRLVVEGRARRRARRPSGRAARPASLFRSSSRRLSRGHGSSPKRSSSPASGLPEPGRSREPPAMTLSTALTVSSSTRPRRRR